MTEEIKKIPYNWQGFIDSIDNWGWLLFAIGLGICESQKWLEGDIARSLQAICFLKVKAD